MTSTDTQNETPSPATPAEDAPTSTSESKEYGGPKEQKPTRYGDWTVKGRCIDF